MALSSREYIAYCGILTPALFLVAYLLYCGIALPIEINTHRLRYHPLESFEMYSFTLSLWNKYHMNTNGISIITFQQQKPYQYQYYLGLFHDDNITVSNDSVIRNISQKTWAEFTYIIEQNKPSTIFISQWSQSECSSFADCFQEHFPTASDYVYTPISNEHFIDINSEDWSDALDETRDIVTAAVLVILCAILILLLISIPSFDNNPTCFLIGTVFIGAYFCWVFALSVIPILFCTPHGQNPEYWEEAQVSLSFTVGEYNPAWWVSGVLNNGVWMYSLLFFCPAFCGCFCLVASCSCWCEIYSEQKAEEISLGILMVFVGTVIVGLIGMTLAYIVILIANLTFWDETTFNSFDNEFVIQCFMALICIWILFPMLGCAVAVIGKKHDLRIESINSLKESIVSMRSRTRRSGSYGNVQAGEDCDTIAMTEPEESQETQHILTT